MKNNKINEALILIKNSASENERDKAKLMLANIVGHHLENWNESSIKEAYLNPDNLACKKELEEALRTKIEFSIVQQGDKTMSSSIFAIPFSIESDLDIEIMAPVISEINSIELRELIKESLVSMDPVDINEPVITVFERAMTAEDVQRMGSCWLHELHQMSGSQEHSLALLDNAFEVLPHYELIKSDDPKIFFILFSAHGSENGNQSLDHSKIENEKWIEDWQDRFQLLIRPILDERITIKIHKPSDVLQAISNENSLAETVSINSILTSASLTLLAVPAEMYFRFVVYEKYNSANQVFFSIHYFNTMIYGRTFENPSSKFIENIVEIANKNKMAALGFNVKDDVAPSSLSVYGSMGSTQPLTGTIH